MRTKLLAAVMAALVFLGSSVPVHAATYGNGQTTGGMTVTLTIESTYSISLPATLALQANETTTDNANDYIGTYTVGVKANLDDNHIITVIPEASFTMDNTALAGDSITANVSQPVTIWANTKLADNEIAANRNSFVSTEGVITTETEKVGSYSGTLNFTFAKTTRS